MSGIYIPNMVNPVRCSECDFCPYGYCGLLDRYVRDSAYKDTDCPLIPVQPHGRLIDADVLMELYADTDDLRLKDMKVPIAVIRQNIMDMPTIIPTDEPLGKSEQLNL